MNYTIIAIVGLISNILLHYSWHMNHIMHLWADAGTRVETFKFSMMLNNKFLHVPVIN